MKPPSRIALVAVALVALAHLVGCPPGPPAKASNAQPHTAAAPPAPRPSTF